MKHSQDLLKSFANRLSRIAMSDDGRQTLSLLQLTGLLGQPSKNTMKSSAEEMDAVDKTIRGMASDKAKTDRVGIWERKDSASHFARRLDTIEDWNYWAQVGRIEPKRAKVRIVLIGESVARGYLYDPQFTPAMALESILQSHFGKGGVEVIDLGRTNLRLDLKDLAISALLLQPDAVVIFAGNNWAPSGSPADYSRDELVYMDSVLREHGVHGLKGLAEKGLVDGATVVVKEINSAYEQKGIPLLWIIPEFNLGDWRDPVVNAPHLSDAANVEWITCRQGAQSALQAGDFPLATRLAKRMVELDQGVSVAGFYFLAECSLKSGELAESRHYLECARDATIWDASFMKSPRTFTIAQKTLREESLKYKKGDIIDLPKLFDEYLKGSLPDRRLFLDYCHLTAEGIQVAMAATASGVLRNLKRTHVPWRSLISKSMAPSRRVEAEASFLAAVHNAHWYQSYELVRYYCRRALEFAPDISEAMICFLDFQTRQARMLMSKSGEKLAGLPWPSIHFYLFNVQIKQLDRLLLDAVVDALREVGIEAATDLGRIRQEERSVSRGSANLLDYYYCSSAMQPQELLWVTPSVPMLEPSDYYRAYWLKSHFFFVGSDDRPVSLSLTCRLPDLGLEEGKIIIEVNGKNQGEMVITRKWETWDIVVAEDAMLSGVNEVVICWPLPRYFVEESLKAAVDGIRQKARPELYCIFGEIHTFTVAHVE
ncbi:MAG: SGNH/GDSL hydrolase family protein [Pseudomonas sp.]